MLAKIKQAEPSLTASVFSREAPYWWDEKGPFGILHRLNPVRISYILDRVNHLKKAGSKPSQKPLQNMRLLDIGCGGGLLTEPLTRLGASVVGIDRSEVALQVARAHAEAQHLKIEYRLDRPGEALSKTAESQFDIITALEVVEHVDHRQEFLRSLVGALKPGGYLFISTLNRTLRSYLFGIVFAEHVLGLVPKGTHDWKQFVSPAEISEELKTLGMHLTDLNGLQYNVFSKTFSLHPKAVRQNYIAVFQKHHN